MIHFCIRTIRHFPALGDVVQFKAPIQPPGRTIPVKKKVVIIIVHVIDENKPELFQIAYALYPFRFFFCLVQSGQEHAREDGDDRDDDE